MKLTYFGHSAIGLAEGDARVVIDPFLSGNPHAGTRPEDVEADTIVVTHAHEDHVGDTVAIARRTGATVVACVEVARALKADGVAVVGANVGGRVRRPWGAISFTPAWHSSSFGDGTYGGLAMGAVLEIAGLRVYHAGDTALFGDMALIGDRGVDVALLPIGDHFTMGPDDAHAAVRLLRPRHVVPIHYDTFGAIEQDAGAFRDAVQGATDAIVHPLAPGEAIEL